MTTSQAKDIVQEPVSLGDKVLESGAEASQSFAPIRNICAHLNAFHIYADDPGRVVEAQHYCSHLSSDIRQCIIYDSPAKNARLIGIEYLITKRLYSELPPEEKKLWHSHVFEVKSGQLIMPQSSTSTLPTAVWEKAESREMENIIGMYGKTYHLWQVDRDDAVPMGEPKLMMSFTQKSPGFERVVKDRDERFGVDHERKAELREYIEEPEKDPDADNWDHSKQI